MGVKQCFNIFLTWDNLATLDFFKVETNITHWTVSQAHILRVLISSFAVMALESGVLDLPDFVRRLKIL